MSHLEGTVRVTLLERPHVASAYSTQLKLQHSFWAQPTLLHFAVNAMKNGKMQAHEFGDLVMQALRVVCMRRITAVRLHDRVKAGRQNTARLVLEVDLDDNRTYRVTVDPRLDGPEILTRHSPESPMLNGENVRPQREYVNKAITDVLHLVIVEMSQTRA